MNGYSSPLIKNITIRNGYAGSMGGVKEVESLLLITVSNKT